MVLLTGTRRYKDFFNNTDCKSLYAAVFNTADEAKAYSKKLEEAYDAYQAVYLKAQREFTGQLMKHLAEQEKKYCEKVENLKAAGVYTKELDDALLFQYSVDSQIPFTESAIGRDLRWKEPPKYENMRIVELADGEFSQILP